VIEDAVETVGTHEVKLEKTEITAFARVKDKTDKNVIMVMTFSGPVMESILGSTAKEMGLENYSVSESYISIAFDLEKFKKQEDICSICKEFLAKVDVKVADARKWESALLKSLE
jgi:hypothetical protein